MEAKEINWTDLLGNPYRYGLNPSMIRSRGYQHHGCVCVKGGSKDKRATIPVVINFDEEYVIAYLIKIIYEKLQPQNYNDFQKLLAKTWKRYKESNPNGEQAVLVSRDNG